MSKLDKVEFDHEKAISEEGIKNQQLSADIRGKIRAFNMHRSKVAKKGDESITEKDVARLEAMSVAIAGNIYDHLEDELEEMEAEKNKTKPVAATPAPVTVAAAEPATPAPATVAAVIETPAPAAAAPAASTTPEPSSKEDKDFVLFDGLI